MRNVEIKAKIDNPDLKILRVMQLTNHNCITLKQHDIFFKVTEGRLKLRKFEDGSGELIYYKRFNKSGPKLCDYQKVALSEHSCSGIVDILSASNGCIGTVKKTRKVYMIGQTRVHIDDVEGLGNFLELEVVLTDEQDIETGEMIARDLMSKLDIKNEDLIANAYMDLLNESMNGTTSESISEATNESKEF
ncbi:hypothetical protein E2986_09584 [Frieseomelitta varia]|uniref:CYTH domain-containing protein n=1 Tax=Frieseomelitta varia TaxID=561572 RepID=A0A833S8Y6_9HYME|nr:uncharacterized protein LOC122527753 [Frieseomelitta varia]KAF3428091.1 hypothetical protein E2986_09584 [Frieseomelitta varia]